jgi:hypothetical protein
MERYLTDTQLEACFNLARDKIAPSPERAIANAAADNALQWVIEELRADIIDHEPCACGHDIHSQGQVDALDRMIRFFQHCWAQEGGV